MLNTYKLLNHTKLIFVCSFCLLFCLAANAQTVNCPAETNLGTFDCTSINDVPDQPNNVEEASAAPYNIEITGATSSTRVTVEESGTIFYCEIDDRTVTRDVIIYDDADISFTFSPDEEIARCTFTIETSPDTEAPVFEAPVDGVFSCDIDIDDLSVTGAVVTITDNNCPVNIISEFAFYADAIADGECPGEVIITRSWTAVDPCGNASDTQTQRIELKDEAGPEFSPPGDVTIPCGSDIDDLSLTGEVTDATDACDNTSTIEVNYVDIETMEDTPCAGSTTIIRRWGAVDGCGNPTTNDQTIIVECPADCSNQDICAGDIVTDPLPGECDCQIVEEQVLGCTDPAANNYDPAANCDDGNCAADFDLALIKVLASSGPFTPGGDVTFTITVFNQGDVTAQNIEITDYTPAGLILNDANWTDQGDGTATTTIAGPLAAGEDESVDITFTIPADAAAGSFENFAEISSAEDEDGNPGMDIDSTPDNDPNNDNNTDDVIDNSNDDEDDHDGAIFEIACIDGCTDPAACNYDAAATCDDDSCMTVPTCNDDPCAGDVTALSADGCSCEPVTPQVLGCTDAAACNYNADANCDDGTCMAVPTCNGDPCAGDVTALSADGCTCEIAKPQVLGCTDSSACNYNPDANCNDGSCMPIPVCNDDPCIGSITTLSADGCTCELVTNQVLGCTDPAACNYNADANCDDNSCLPVPECNTNPCWGDITKLEGCDCVVVEPQVLGCNDPLADNYDANANCNDGSCTYPSPCPPKMRVCAAPQTPLEICLPCILSGELDAEVTDVNTLFAQCEIDGLDDENVACFTYTPLPLAESPSEIEVTYCTPRTGQCWTILVIIDIDPSCGDDGGEPTECPTELNLCTTPTVNFASAAPLEICIDCITDGSYPAEITDVASLFYCSIDDLDDDNQACFTYLPVPLMELYSPEQLTVTYCLPGTNDCMTTIVNIDIKDDCGGVVDPPDPCDVNGGTLTGGPFNFCVNDGTPDYATGVTLSGDSGDFSAWVLTDDQYNILGLPSSLTDVDFDGAGSGTCLIWNISYDNVSGLYQGANANDFDGCYALSNSIEVNRKDDCPADDVSGCTDANACNYNPDATLDDGSCAKIDCSGTCGGSATPGTACTDSNGNASVYANDCSCPDENIPGCTDANACNYNPDATDDDGSCAELDCIGTCGGSATSGTPCTDSNGKASTYADDCSCPDAPCPAAPATISGGPFTFCVGDGTADYVSGITVSGGTGANSAWVITDDEMNILGLPSMPGVVDFDGAGVDICLIWYVNFDDMQGAEVGLNAANLSGCYALSNSISVTRETCEPPPTECATTLQACSEAFTPETPDPSAELCIPCIIDGTFDGTVTDVDSKFNCSIDDLEDDKPGCFTYKPLPLLQNYSPDILTVEYCDAANNCNVVQIIVEIKEGGCGGLVLNQSGVEVNDVQPINILEQELLIDNQNPSDKTSALEDKPQIFPVPSSGAIFVTVSEEMKGSEIKIYNTAGQLIQAKEIDNDQEDSTVYIFDIRSFENGVYYLVAEKGDKIQTSQFIKQ